MIEINDEDIPTGRLISVDKRKARNNYTCNDCNELIKKDEIYYPISVSFDGEIFHLKICGECTDGNCCMKTMLKNKSKTKGE